MRHSSILFILAAFLLLALLPACSFSLAEDITPPPGFEPTEPAPTQVAVVVRPVVPPDPAAGAALYAEKCAPCHGDTGMGDGAQSGNLPSPPPALGDPQVRRAASPSQWYQMVTNGNMRAFMPPFADSLSDRQRWDVVAYLYTLGAGADQLAQAEDLYAGQCQSCHGEDGRGDGPQAAALAVAPPNWVDSGRLAGWTDQALWEAITNGVEPAMPGFAASLSDDQRWALTGLVRSLSFRQDKSGAVSMEEGLAEGLAETPAAGQVEAATPQATPPAEAGDLMTVTGQVVNGSGGQVPAGLEVTLQGFDGMQASLEESSQIDAGGFYHFEGIQWVADRVLFVTAQYQGITFNSDFLHASDLTPGSAVQLPLMIYETSTDAGQVTADRMHVFFEFLPPDKVQVVELFILTNPTDRVIVPAGEGQPVIRFKLPAGAANLQFEEGSLGGRFVQTADGFGDTLSIPPQPAQQQILFAFELPYEKKHSFSLDLPLPVDALVVAVPGNGVRLQSDQLQSGGERTVQGLDLQVFMASALPAGGTLDLTLSGWPDEGGSGAVAPQQSIWIGAAAFVLAVGIAATWLLLRRRSLAAGEAVEAAPAAGPEDNLESLLDAIVALDDLYKAGSLPENAYQERRAELMRRLKEVRARGSEAS
ncbi:MAG: c-type cytochrome [Chloroflexi bacterium]|nr:c-type cytochrome [Chloroflexota bacterium]